MAAPHDRTVFGGYPFATVPVLAMEMAQALAFFGISVILTVYMLEWLGWAEGTSMAVFHIYTVLAYVFCIFGGMIADSTLGRFRTLVISSVIFSGGFLVLSLTSMDKTSYGYIVGLVLVAFGSAGVRPTVPALGADQFTPQQAPQRDYFFGLYYIFRNIGSFVGFIVLPMLRAYVNCYENTCYPLAFGFPALVMVIATAFLCTCHKNFKLTPPSGDIITRFFGCIFSALKGKMKGGSEPRDHWLQYANTEKYSESFIEDTKSVLHVLVMMTPWPFFWALYDQLGSSWIIQAKEMNGELGSIIIYPDQLSAANSLFIVILIPFVHRIVYPCLNRFNIPNTLCQRITAGMFVVGGSFMIGGCLQLFIHAGNPVHISQSQTRVRFANTLPCDLNITLPDADVRVTSRSNEVGIFNTRPPGFVHANPFGCPHMAPSNDTLEFNQGEDAYVVVYSMENTTRIRKVYSNQTRREVQGSSGLRLINTLKEEVDVKLMNSLAHTIHHMNISDLIARHRTLPSGSYFLSVEGEDFPLSLINGALYTIVLHRDSNDQINITQYEDVPPYIIHIFWQLPQFLLLSLGETFFSVNALDFTYSQAPISMKSVLTGFNLLSSAFGNLLVAILSTVLIVDNLAYIFFTYAGLDFFGMVLFVLLAINYNYVDNYAESTTIDEYSSEKSSFREDEVQYSNENKSAYGIKSIDNPAFEHPENTRF